MIRMIRRLKWWLGLRPLFGRKAYRVIPHATRMNNLERRILAARSVS